MSNIMAECKQKAIETTEYKEFVDKFVPKKTTDDCYTPDYIYDCVKDYVLERFCLHGRQIVRPFYPGGDYENFDYPPNSVVIDNPPFSIISKICKFYVSKNIDFFVFAPAMTLFNACKFDGVNGVVCGAQITYENGAIVNTSFLTNLGEFKILTDPDLYDALDQIQKKQKRKMKKELPKYQYPDCVVSAAILHKLAHHGQKLTIKSEDCFFVRALDAQREEGKTIFGTGFLISEKAAAEKAAAEKAAAEKAAAEKAAAERWRLSEEEKRIISNLGGVRHE